MALLHPQHEWRERAGAEQPSCRHFWVGIGGLGRSSNSFFTTAGAMCNGDLRESMQSSRMRHLSALEWRKRRNGFESASAVFFRSRLATTGTVAARFGAVDMVLTLSKILRAAAVLERDRIEKAGRAACRWRSDRATHCACLCHDLFVSVNLKGSCALSVRSTPCCAKSLLS